MCQENDLSACVTRAGATSLLLFFNMLQRCLAHHRDKDVIPVSIQTPPFLLSLRIRVAGGRKNMVG